MPYENTHTRTIDGRTYDIDALIRRVAGRKPHKVRLPKASRSSRDGFSPLRYLGADTAYPIPVTRDGTVVDGRHRVIKLRDQGASETDAITVTPDDLLSALLPPDDTNANGKAL